MNKLKQKYKINLLNYKSFLKDTKLKIQKKKLSYLLFENHNLLTNKNLNYNTIELNNFQNLYVSSTHFKKMYTINDEYKNQFLFNYNLNFKILNKFNKLLFKILSKKKKIIKGRITGGTNGKIFLYSFGFIFKMSPKHLNAHCNSKKKTFYFNKSKKKGYFSFVKIIKAKQIIKSYKLRNLYFNFDIIKTWNKKTKINFSRIIYIENLLKNKELTVNNSINKKSSFSKKPHRKKKKNKTNYATI